MGFFSSIGNAIGGIVGGVGSAIGGILGANSQKDANSANLDFARQQFEYQKELHKNQLQWRVEDAKKAGLHPMAALGLQSSSFSPVSSNMQANDYSWIGDLGQSAGYAAMKGKDKEQQSQAQGLLMRQGELQADNLNLQNEGLKLDNEFRRFQLQQAVVGATNQALSSPANASFRKRLIDGQGDSPSVGSGSDNNDGSYSGPTVPLLTLSRTGNTLLDIINPDIADSVTESAYRNGVAAIAPEWNIAQGYLKPPVEYLTPLEQAKVRKGELELTRFPGGWALRDTKTQKIRKRVKALRQKDNKKPSWSRRLDKAFFDWLNRTF